MSFERFAGFFGLLLLLSASGAHAYSGSELRDDCMAAEVFYAQKKSSDPYQSIKGARCMAYIGGFAEGFLVGDFLADKVGVRLNAFCLPLDGDLSYRLVRAVLSHLDRQSPTLSASNGAATVVAGALSTAFPCPDSGEKIE